MEWEEEKQKAWQRLWEDLHIGYLDEDILDVLIEIFMRPHSFPKSSCSGRITLIDSNYPWAKEETMTIFKKHGPVDLEEIEAIYDKPVANRLWLSVQGPIYHIDVYSLEEAKTILAAAREAGFKHSGIMVISRHPLVELRTGIRGDILLKTEKGEKLLGRNGLQEAVRVANEILLRAKERNRRLLAAPRRRRPPQPWRPAAEKAHELGLL